jgi:BolA protein
MLLIDDIKNRLQCLLPLQLDIQDDSALHAGHKGNGGGGHFTLTIKSEAFCGQSAVARHRMIYQALSDLMPHRIHALSIRAIASDE